MKDLFVPYEQSLQLKELGFDEPCIKEYHLKKLLPNSTGFEISNSSLDQLFGDSKVIAAPTFSQAFRWFRDKHNLLNIIDCYISTPLEWFIRIDKISNDSLDYKMDITEESEDKVYLTYEEAEIACLDKLIEILKSI